MSERHYRLLRNLWLGVFYVMVGAQLALLCLDWQRHATAITWLGMSIPVVVGSTWPLLFQPSLRSRRSRGSCGGRRGVPPERLPQTR
jgi:hypothetical protein